MRLYFKNTFMTLAALVAAGVFFHCQGAAPVIHGNIVGPEDGSDYVSGIYKFSAAAPLAPELEKQSMFIIVNGGGDYVEGQYLYISNFDGLGTAENYRAYLYDASTWIPKGNFRLPGNYSASDFAYDSATGRLYGTFSADRQDWSFGWMNPADGEFHPLRQATAWPAVGVTRLGAVYAVDAEGYVLAVNKSDGTFTRLFSTGITPAGTQSGCMDREADILYWTVGGGLYSIDIAAQTVSKVGDFPVKEPVAGAYILPAAPSGIPAVTGLKLTAAGVSFVMPDGVTDYRVITDGLMPGISGTSASGVRVNVPLDLSEGEHTVSVFAAKDGKFSPAATASVFNGADAPLPVTDLRAWREGDTFKASWTAPAGSANGGSMGTITYEIKFIQGDGQTVHTVTDTRFESTISAAAPQDCSVEVTALNDGTLRSASVTSVPVMMGPGIALPYSETFTGSAPGFMALDANQDGATWYFEEIDNDLRTDYKSDFGDMDDWAFTPILALDPDHFYQLRFNSQTAGPTYEESMEVCLGKLRTPEAMTQTIVPERTYASRGYVTNRAYFTVADDAPAHIGFHSVTRGKNLYLALDNITVEAAGPLTAPAAPSDLKAVVVPGQTTATVHFTAPTLNLDGSAATEMTAEVRRSGRRQGRIESVTPGATYTFAVQGTQGANTFEIFCSNTTGAGMPAFVDAHLGQDKPLPPVGVTVIMGKDGNPLVSWKAPEGGVNGGVMDPDRLTYSVRRGFDRDYILQDSPETSVSDPNGIPVEQALMYYEVFAKGPGGTSEPASSEHFTMGTPYALPYFESFKDGMESRGPWLGMLLDNPHGAWYIDSEGTRPVCSDADGNGGLVTFAPSEAGHVSSLATPLLDIRDADCPVLEFYVFGDPGDDSRLTVEARTPSKPRTLLRSALLSEFPQGWSLVRLSLEDFVGEDYMQVFFTGTAGVEYANHIALDCIMVTDMPRRDLAALSVQSPDILRPGESADFRARIANVGFESVSGAQAVLFRNGEPVAVADVPETAPLAETEVRLSFTPTLGDGELGEYCVIVSAEGDTNDANDITPTAVIELELPFYPVPVASGGIDGEDAVVVWHRPAHTGLREPVTDGFESYPAFAIAEVGEWTMHDIDGRGGTTGITDPDGNPLSYENMGAPMAYQVFNPALAGLQIVDEDGNPTICAVHRGSQMMCAFCDLDAYNNDWLVSPRLDGSAQTVYFYARSYTAAYGLEAFCIMTSKSGTEVKDFTALTGVANAPVDWTRFSVDLPAGTRHFAIRCVSIDQFALCVDDVKFIPESAEPVDLVLTGYRLYRDGELFRSFGPDETRCTLPAADVQDTELRLSAVYDRGESAHSAPVVMGIGGIGDLTGSVRDARAIPGGIAVTQPAGERAEVYTVDGRLTASVAGSATLSLAKGVYMVRLASATKKLIVK